MNYTNILAKIKTLYNLKSSDPVYTDITETHMDLALGGLIKPVLGNSWYLNYFNRPELSSVNITSCEEYTSDTDYVKLTTASSHYLTDGQNVILNTTNDYYDGIYKIKLILDSTTKTGYELDTFLIFDTFTLMDTGTYEDQIKQDLDFCLAVFTLEKSVGYSRSPLQFDFN